MTPAHSVRPVRPRVLLVLGLVALVLFIALAGVIASGHDAAVQGIDDWWRRLVGQQPGRITSNPVVLVLQAMGKRTGSFVVPAVVLVVLAALRRRWAALYALILFAFCGGVMNLGMKLLVQRPRPVAEPTSGLAGPLFGEHGFTSFPSGHASLAVAILLVVLVATRGRARVVGACLAGALVVGMVLERTMVNAHWLSDTCGSILGVGAVGLLLWWWMEPRLAAERDRFDASVDDAGRSPR